MPASPAGRLPAAGTILLAFALLTPLSSGDGPAGGGCEGAQEVAHLGAACRVAGGWQVPLGGDAFVFTHGPDALPAGLDAADAAPARILEAGLRAPQPSCVRDARTEAHNHVIYAVAADKGNRYATLAPVIEALVRQANLQLALDAASLGHSAAYRMRCDGDSLVVSEAVLPTPFRAASFSTIVRDLRAQGYASPLAKYWIWYDDRAGSVAGIGTLWLDDRPGPENYNNRGPSYAVTFGLLSAEVMMHESGHNLGAVQLSAPHSSGAFHCTDGADVMCYPDGGRNAWRYSNRACGLRKWFDCNHDDYFHPDPAPGSYLATRWNIGSAASRFVEIRRI